MSMPVSHHPVALIQVSSCTLWLLVCVSFTTGACRCVVRLRGWHNQVAGGWGKNAGPCTWMQNGLKCCWLVDLKRRFAGMYCYPITTAGMALLFPFLSDPALLTAHVWLFWLHAFLHFWCWVSPGGHASCPRCLHILLSWRVWRGELCIQQQAAHEQQEGACQLL